MSETITYLIKFCAMFFLILLLIFILAVVTPKLASKIDKLISRIIKPKPEGWMIIYIKLKVFMIYLKKKTLLKKIMKTEILKMAKNNSKMVEAITPMDEDFANGTPIL